MGTYEELVRDTVEVVLEPGRPLTLTQIANAVAPRLFRLAGSGVFVNVEIVVEGILRADSKRFVEVAPGLWARRSDGPEAGVPTRPRRPPFAGSAAAEATPEPRSSLDAVGGAGGKVSPAAL